MSQEPKWSQRSWRYRREAGSPGNTRAGERPPEAPPGSSGYIWRVPPEAATRTRAEHLALNGVRCSWDEPPIISRRTGERGHPGHDPSCRCYAEPVFD